MILDCHKLNHIFNDPNLLSWIKLFKRNAVYDKTETIGAHGKYAELYYI